MLKADTVLMWLNKLVVYPYNNSYGLAYVIIQGDISSSWYQTDKFKKHCDFQLAHTGILQPKWEASAIWFETESNK